MINNIIEAIDHVALTSPEHICYVDSDHQYTYGTLKTMSDHLAGYFAQQFPNREPIIVFGGQTFEMIVTFLGLSKSGHAYIPVDTHSPNERIPQIQSVAQPAAVIAVEDLPIEITDVPVINKDQLMEAAHNDVYNYDMGMAVSKNDNYYIIFTSGTTGMPKGVQISHDNLLSFVNWDVDSFNLPQGVKAISQAPYSFDLSVMDLYPTLVLGGTLYALPRQLTDNFKQLFEVLPTLGINEWVSTPSFAEVCLLDPNFKQANYPDLNRFLFCGEELTNKTARALLGRFPDAQIYNTYGPTEATVAVTGIQITTEIVDKYQRLPIGYAKPDTKVFIADDDLQPVKDGEKGEIIIAGPSVSKGYLNNPEKTAKAFFKYEGEQAYHTGDLGLMENNLLFYRGRSDFQVKLHGYRIELEDVDHNLNQVSYVKQATTVPRYDKNCKVSQLVAYVVPNDNDFESEFALTQAIKKELGEMVMSYMIPQRFIYRDSLPLTANGKVDRKSLMAEVNNK